MRKLLVARSILACVLAYSVPPVQHSRAQETCNNGKITVAAPTDESHDACAAVAEVQRYFAAGGLDADLVLTIRFQPSVFVEIVGASSLETIPVLGRFHWRKGEIQMLRLNLASTVMRRPWSLPWNAEIARSILRHEITHAVIAKLLGEKYDKLPPPWHEALAYAVQIDLMSAELRERVLAAYPDAEPFGLTLEINDFAYGFNPDRFAVRAYLTYARDGRMAFLKKALALEHEMIDLREYFN